MADRTIRIDDIKDQNFIALLRDVLKRGERLTVIVSDDEAVSIGPSWPVEPLPELEGYVPEGWKDAIYGR